MKQAVDSYDLPTIRSFYVLCTKNAYKSIKWRLVYPPQGTAILYRSFQHIPPRLRQLVINI
jgi:hypothetical protein